MFLDLSSSHEIYFNTYLHVVEYSKKEVNFLLNKLNKNITKLKLLIKIQNQFIFKKHFKRPRVSDVFHSLLVSLY